MKGNSSLQLEKVSFSKVGLNALGKMLQQEKCSVEAESKQIQNQIELRRKIQKKLDKNCDQVNTEGQSLSRSYQIEKEKHKKLLMLVAYYQQAITVKVDQTEEQIDKNQNELLRMREREIQKILEKFNHSSYDITRKMDIIRSLRSERTVFSALFHKIQKELFQLQQGYKLLVIERTVLEQSYNQQLHQFSMHQQKYKKNQPIKESFILERKSHCQPKIKEQSITFYQKEKKPFKVESYPLEINVQENNLYYQNQIQNIYKDFNVQSVKELPSNVQFIQQYCDKILEKIKIKDQQIYKENQQIEIINKKKHLQQTFGGKKIKNTNSIKEKCIGIEKQIQKQKNQAYELLQSLRKMKLTQKREYLNNTEQIEHLLTFLHDEVIKFAPESTKVSSKIKKEPNLLKEYAEDQFEDKMKIFNEQEFTIITKNRIHQILQQ